MTALLNYEVVGHVPSYIMFTTFAFGQDDTVESLHLRVNSLDMFDKVLK